MLKIILLLTLVAFSCTVSCGADERQVVDLLAFQKAWNDRANSSDLIVFVDVFENGICVELEKGQVGAAKGRRRLEDFIEETKVLRGKKCTVLLSKTFELRNDINKFDLIKKIRGGFLECDLLFFQSAGSANLAIGHHGEL